MTNIDDAQTTAIYYGKGAALPTSIAVPSGVSIVETPTTATAFQVSAARAANLYINVRTSAALTIAIGPDNTAAIVLSASQSDALGTHNIYVPAGWYVKLTGTMANLAITAVLL